MKKKCYFSLSVIGVVALALVLLGGGVFTSCNLSDTSNNTVRLVMPGGSARSVQINTADEIDYYNVTINNQKFEMIRHGASVESSPIPVGAKVHITVEAIGNVRGEKSPITELQGKRVAFFETTRTMENGGINISVKMKDYITEYCLVTLVISEAGNIHPADWNSYASVYVEKGKSYTPPNFGKYSPAGEFADPEPRKHTGWQLSTSAPSGGQTFLPGETITVTEDITLELQTEKGVELILSGAFMESHDNTIYETKVISNDVEKTLYYVWLPFTLPSATEHDTRKPITEWEWDVDENNTKDSGKPGDVVINAQVTENNQIWIMKK